MMMASLSSIYSINNMAAISSGHTVNRISSWTRNKTQFMGSGMDWRNPWLAKMSKGNKKRKHWQSSQLFHTRKIYWNPSNWLVCLFLGGSVVGVGNLLLSPIQTVIIPQQMVVFSFLTWTLPLPSTPPPMNLLAKST